MEMKNAIPINRLGTPGRVDDLISTGKISVSQVRFLVLDDADGLLSAGYLDFIMRVYNHIAQITSDRKRLQVIVCAATLHSFDVKKLYEKSHAFYHLGEDSVPETVHHIVMLVDPKTDRLWERLVKNHVRVGYTTVDVLAPTVQELAALENKAQTSFLHFGYLPDQLFRTFPQPA